MIEKTWSFWEKTEYWSKADLCIIGAGITGLSAAIFAKMKAPQDNIVVLERGFLPEGASTKNAGFACFGSIGELIVDISENGQKACIDLVKERYEGLKFLRSLIADESMDYSACGGVEIFNKEQEKEWQMSQKQMLEVNAALQDYFGEDPYAFSEDYRSFTNCIGSIRSPFEASLNPAKMMQALTQKAQGLGVKIFYNCEVISYKKEAAETLLEIKELPDFKCDKLLICTNAFSGRFGNFNLKPVRNMVLISREFEWPFPEAVYHAQAGYFYFRRVDKRLLIGGGRHLHADAESTQNFGINPKVKASLLDFCEKYLGLNEQDFFEDEWSGILGIGKDKSPIIEEIEQGVYTAFRLGGMGVAIGARTGFKAVELIYS